MNRMTNPNAMLPLMGRALQLGLLLILGYSFVSALASILRCVRYKEALELDGVLRTGRFLLWYGGAFWLCATLMHFGTWLCYEYRPHREAAALMLWAAPLYMAAALFYAAVAAVALWGGESQKLGDGLLLRDRILTCYSIGLCFFLSAWLFA